MADLETIGDRIGLPSHMKIMRVDPKTLKKNEEISGEEVYTVLVNPESYKVSHRMVYQKDQAINSLNPAFRFNNVASEGFDIELLFDSTGSLGNVPILNQKTVLEQINQFLEIGYPVEKDDCGKVKSLPLLLIWGDMKFKGFLEAVDITYSHFDATGSPIRATASCKFTGGQIKVGKNPNVNVKPKKKVDYAKEKHAINGVLKYGSYLTIVSSQPRSALPKSLRLAEEIIKLII